MTESDIDKLTQIRNKLFTALFPSLFVILIFLLSFKDIFKVLFTMKKGIKKIYYIFILLFILLAAIGAIVLFFIVNNKISIKKLDKTVFSKCYNDKLEEAKEEIIKECNE